jgi:hypothetical protein
MTHFLGIGGETIGNFAEKGAFYWEFRDFEETGE